MHALSCECVKEHGKGCNQGFTLTGCHFRNHAPLLLVGLDTAVQDDTADELDIIVNHVPGNLVAAGNPVVLPNGLVALDGDEFAAFGCQLPVKICCSNLYGGVLRKAACGRLNYCKCLGKDFVQDDLDGVVLVLHQLVALACKSLLAGYGDILLQFFLNLCYTVFKGLLHLTDTGFEGLRVCTKLIVREFVNFRVDGQNLVKDGLYCLHVPVTLSAEYLLKYVCYCHNCFYVYLAKILIPAVFYKCRKSP